MPFEPDTFEPDEPTATPSTDPRELARQAAANWARAKASPEQFRRGGGVGGTWPPQVPTGLRIVEQYGAIPVGQSIGAAAGAPGGLPGAMAGGAIGQAGTAAAVEAVNRALGYAPQDVSPVSEAVSGAIAVPAGKALEAIVPPVMRAGRKILGAVVGERAVQKAKEKAADVVSKAAAIKLPVLRDRVEKIAQSVMGKGIQGEAESTIRNRAAQRQAQRLAQLTGSTLEESLARKGVAAATVAGAVPARQRGGAGILETLYRRVQRGYGQQYERLYRPFVNNELAPEQLADFAGNARAAMADQQNFQTLPGGLRRIMERISTLDENPLEQFREQAIVDLKKNMPGLEASEQAIQKQMKLLADEAGVSGHKLGELLQIKGDLREFFHHNAGPARYASTEMTNDVIDTLDTLGLAKDPQLNAEYRAWRQFRWTGPKLRKLHTTELPEDLGDFFQAEMIGPLLDKAKWQEKARLRRAWGDYVNITGQKPQQIARALPEPVLTKFLGPQGPTSKMLSLDAQSAGLEQLYAAMPGLGHQFANEYNSVLTHEVGSGLKQMKGKIVSSLTGLGDSGKSFARMIAPMDPEHAVQYYYNVIDHPQFSEALADAARQGITIDEVLKNPVYSPLRHTMFLVGVGAGEMMMKGSITSPYILAGLMMEPAMLSIQPIRRALTRSLTTGQLAEFERLIQRATTTAGARRLARFTARAVASDALRAAGEVKNRLAPPQPESGQTLPVIAPGVQPVVQ